MVKEGPWRLRDRRRGEDRRRGLGDLGVTAKRVLLHLDPSSPAQASIAGLSRERRKSWKPSSRALRGSLCPAACFSFPGLSVVGHAPKADDWKQSSWSSLPGFQEARIYSLLGGKKNYLECALEVGN